MRDQRTHPRRLTAADLTSDRRAGA